ncbi:hypothetical protein [Streptomyces sp. NBC_00872]|uniref:hypothetical protein n=1 Tax=Streptomyces sp. NBC_00872 TaxID=2903686 RepID=UPI00386A38B9|nr:hypothetical protein OG214_15265 [Streptomyces sp. NBC_00872]
MRPRYARTLRWIGALVAMLALTWVCAPSAVAGGPTSVLVASPESGETAALYYSDGDYEELMRQLGALADPMARPTGQPERPVSLDGAVGSRLINVTWMVHDVQPWRVDQLYPSADPATVWIHTAFEPSSSDGVWRRAKRPAQLHTLLRKLGVMGPKTGESAAPGALVPSASAGPEEDRGTESAGSRSSGADAGSVWWWAIPGLAAGVAIGLGVRPLVARLPRPPFRRGGERGPGDGPRQQLLDV